MEFNIIFLSIVALVVIGLSLPPALRAKSWKRFFLSALLSVAGILFPLFIFVMSMFLVPRWKGGGDHGWLDCFHFGKLALTPLVLWACAAFYMGQILKPTPKPRAWVDLGLFVGAVTSTVCFIFGLVVHALDDEWRWWLLAPLYVSAWYSLLCVRAIRSSGLNPIAYLITLAGTLPLWAASVFWSKKHYLSLPDNPPDCFVVTAALRGHEWIVGPFSHVERRGLTRIVNSQLATLWRFESLWALHCPRTHRAFRLFYNRIGPQIASRVTTRVAADMVYVLLKPFELLAAAIVALDEYRERRTTASTSISHSARGMRKL